MAMLEWLAQRAAAWARWCATRVLASRPVPQHVAFIMDGNRRYADRQHLRKVEGHVFGYQKLIQALEWCLDLGVRCVSVYAFSIDNYNRSREEVDTLMKLAEDKLAHMLQVHRPRRRRPDPHALSACPRSMPGPSCRPAATPCRRSTTCWRGTASRSG